MQLNHSPETTRPKPSIKLFLTLLFLFSNTLFLFAQVCKTNTSTQSCKDESFYSGEYDSAYLNDFDPITVSIFFWGVKTSTGDLSAEQSDITNIMQKINDAFNPFGICFVLKGFNYLEGNDDLYQNSSHWQIKNYAVNNGYVEENSINCYLPYTFSGPYQGASNCHSQFLSVRTYDYWDGPEVLPLMVNHELGHTFGLKHTFGVSNSSDVIEEHVTRDATDPTYNALTTGDFVHDTPAMPDFWDPAFGSYKTQEGQSLTIIDMTDCSYPAEEYGFTDELGVPLELTPYDIKNFMTYGPNLCKRHFTVGQGIRMNETVQHYYDSYFSQWAIPEISTDLFVKDSPEDFGEEPNVATEHLWESSDIWVRNQIDDIEENQNPEYDPNGQSYVYVRITNKGCGITSGNDIIKLSWAKASTNLSYPYSWIGNPYFPNDPNSPSRGDLIGSINIPSIEPGAEAVVKVPWSIPDPSEYENINPSPWHFCLLAEIISDDDPSTPLPSGSTSLNEYVKINNNVAWKNITVVDLHPNLSIKPIGGVIAVGNPLDQHKSFHLQLSADDEETGKKIFNEAEVSLTLDNILLNAWERGGSRSSNIRRGKDNVFIVTGDNAVLKDLKFNPKEQGTANLKFNFLTKKITEKESYVYRAIQKLSSSGEIFGGETYEINKWPRPLFFADAGNDRSIDKGQQVNLSAGLIGEPATYNWYDSEGNMVYEGADFSTSTEIGKKYKLEVIALSDGYKDYTAVEVKFKPNRIETLSPNPTSGQATVNYQINSGNAAYLSITPINFQNNNVNNYVLVIEENELNINLSNFAQGLYTVALIVDGQISDSKTLIKE